MRSQRASIATDGCSFAPPSGLSFLLEAVDNLLQLANVFARHLSGFGELRHHRLRPPAEEAQDLVEQPMTRDVSLDERLEDVCVADLPHAPDGPFGLHPVDGGLDRRVRRSRFGEGLLNLSNRGVAAIPQGFEDSRFQLGQFWWCHLTVLLRDREYYYFVVAMS